MPDADEDAEDIADILPIIELDISLLQTRFLIDTGACASFVTKQFYDLYKEHLKLNTSKPRRQFVTANGETIDVIGEVTFAVILRDTQYPVTFIVADITTNIIGYNLLRQHDLVLLHNPTRLFSCRGMGT